MDVFLSMFTQWRRAGMAGFRTGMDYSVLPSLFTMRAIPRKQWSDILDDLRVMEDAALEYLSKQK